MEHEGIYVAISAVFAGLATIIGLVVSSRQQARKQLSEDERELRTTLLAEIKRLTDELAEAQEKLAECIAKNGH